MENCGLFGCGDCEGQPPDNRITQLRAKFGGCWLDLRKLHALREKQTSLLKIEALKSAVPENLALGRVRPENAKKLTVGQVHELRQYWTGV